MDTVRMVIVDDHPIVRQGLRAALRVLPQLELVGEAGNGREALAVVAATHPDLVLMDLMMPEMDGLTAIAALKAQPAPPRIIALTTFAEAEQVLGAVQAGADGYLLKDMEMQELARAVRTVLGGQPYLHPAATQHLLRATARPAAPPERLTAREQEVLVLVARGLTNREIARALAISEKTASVHVSNLLGKLGLTSRTQAALHAARLGLVTLGSGDPSTEG